LVDNDFNEASDIAKKFKGFFRITDGVDTFRYKELQTVTITTIADTEKHYSDDGTKSLESIGDSSTFSLTTKKTADLWDTASASSTTQIRTIGFYQNAIINDRLIPLATFEGISETEATSDKFVHVQFTAFVLNIQESRDPTDGSYNVTITGEIKSLTESNRQAT
jgi:hypothetical protein